MITLDDWQKKFINHKGHKILVAGRQTGKSEAQAYDNATFAINNPGTNCLIISKTQRQSEELLIKTLNFLQAKYPKRIGKGKYKPLKQQVWIMPKDKKLKPSRVMCQPTGLAGEGIRGFSIHKLSVDEAQLVSDDVFTSVTPMLLTTGGSISLTGTPKGRNGYFWKAFNGELQAFTKFHVNSRDVINNRPISLGWPEWRRKAALEHLRQEKLRMSSKQYAQEYEGEFVEDLDSLFPEDLIKNTCNQFRPHIATSFGKYYLGVDVGRVHDPSTFEIIDARDPLHMIQVESIEKRGISIPETVKTILELHKKYNFRLIGVDGGGLGSGVVDLLMLERSIRERVRDLNNSQRITTVKSNKEVKRQLLKEQMYYNLLSGMFKNEVKLLSDEGIKVSLASCQIEYIQDSDDVRIFGDDTHHAEGIIRAYWCAIQEKTLNLWAA